MAAKIFIPSEGTKKIGGWPKNRDIFFVPSEGIKMGPRIGEVHYFCVAVARMWHSGPVPRIVASDATCLNSVMLVVFMRK